MIEYISTDLLWDESYKKIIDEMIKLRELQNKHKFDMSVIGTGNYFYSMMDTVFFRFHNIRFIGKIINSILEKIKKYLIIHHKIHVTYFNRVYTTDTVLQSSTIYPIRRVEYPWVINHAELNNSMKILDIGSGLSLFPVYLASKGHDVYSIDNDDIAMEKIAPTLAKWAGTNLHYQVGDMTKLDFNDNTFDRIFCISVLEHLEEENINGRYVNKRKLGLDIKSISEMLRVLKPDGRLILTFDWSEDPVESRAYKLQDVYERLLKKFESNLISHNKLELEWDRLKQQHVKAWRSFPPYQYVKEGWTIGMILKK